MDPNRTLEMLREYLRDAKTDDTVVYEDGHYVFELIESLDAWLSNGGFLPADWQRRRP
jgi:hypothetical protein